MDNIPQNVGNTAIKAIPDKQIIKEILSRAGIAASEPSACSGGNYLYARGVSFLFSGDDKLSDIQSEGGETEW